MPKKTHRPGMTDQTSLAKQSDQISAISLLKLHQSFWAKTKGFTAWQFLRFHPEYVKWLTRVQKFGAVHIERVKRGALSRYFATYEPCSATETYTRWQRRILGESRVDLAAFSEITGDLRKLHNFPKPKGVPDNWLPIDNTVRFPHPNILDRLTPTGLGCAVIRLSARDRKKEPFFSLDRIVVGNTAFWVDRHCYDKDQICGEILDGFPGISKSREMVIRATVADKLKNYRAEDLRQSRERETKGRHPVAAVLAHVLELSNAGKSVNEIAKELSPAEYDGSPRTRRAALQRARDSVEAATRRIYEQIR